MKSPTFWSPNGKRRLIAKDKLKAGEGTGWIASCLKGHEFEQVLGDGEGQGNLARSNLRGHKVLD